VPLKKAISSVSSVGQREMSDYRGIKCMGFRPHLLYDSDARFQAQLPPRVDRQEGSDVDSTQSVSSSTESWDRLKDSDDLYL
jgi:hypothetical protein